MKLDYVHQTSIDEKAEDSRFTYEDSFPPSERPPFDMLLGLNNTYFCGVYDQGEYVGLIDTIEYKDMAYLFFLAIKKENRDKGYGTQILSDLKQRFAGKRLFLLAEEDGPQYEDNAERTRRLSFYSKNGFIPEGIKVVELGVTYEILSYNCSVGERDFFDLMSTVVGEERMSLFYKDYQSK